MRLHYPETEDYVVGCRNKKFLVAMRRTLEAIKLVRSSLHTHAVLRGGNVSQATMLKSVLPFLAAEFPHIPKVLLRATIVDHTQRKDIARAPNEFVLPDVCVYPLKKLGTNDGNYDYGRYVTFWSPGERGLMAVPRNRIRSMLFDRLYLARARVLVGRRSVQVTFCFSPTRIRAGVQRLSTRKLRGRERNYMVRRKCLLGLVPKEGGESDGHEERQKEKEGQQGLLT